MDSSGTRLLITPGEPAGIGPDIVLARAAQNWPARVAAVADPAFLEERAAALGLDIAIDPVATPLDADTIGPHVAGRLTVVPVPLAAPAVAGTLDTQNARYVLNTLTTAVEACVAGHADAMVTGPVHKGIINDAGIAFSGHTEFIARLTDAPLPVMMLCDGPLRVALVTTHLPLSAVPGAITADRVSRVLRVLHADLTETFGLSDPRIAVCGLNPHAGEGGHLGHEDRDVIEPVIERLRERGFNLAGPLPADTAFTARARESADAILCMYHDQGLPALKATGFGHTVNVTLGLPIIRTSVDHGTALDLAGTGKADSGSLDAAMTLAADLAANRRWSA